jgi:hypothetical protein
MKFFFFIFQLAFTQLFASNIFVVGDSHVTEFDGIPMMSTHYLGPMTMHRVGRDQLSAVNIKQYGVKDHDCVVFAFGEIDVRCHIGKQRDLENRTLAEIMHTLVYKYLEAILKNKEQFHHLNCIVYGITPPTDVVNNPEYPRYGPLEERVQLTKQMNGLLESACLQYGIKFLHVYDDFADENGALNKDLSDGNVHIGSHCNDPIKNKLYALY